MGTFLAPVLASGPTAIPSAGCRVAGSDVTCSRLVSLLEAVGIVKGRRALPVFRSWFSPGVFCATRFFGFLGALCVSSTG